MSSNPNTSEEASLPQFNAMQRVKRHFFAMRNGALASQMRQRGLVYQINFGLNIPQVKETAAMVLAENPSSSALVQLATGLWANSSTRESRLLAPMLFPADIMSENLALRWLTEAQTTEVADHLCHSLLRHLPFAPAVAHALLTSEEASELNVYAAMRLIMNLLTTGCISTAEASREVSHFNPDTTQLWCPVLRQILEEISFQSGA